MQGFIKFYRSYLENPIITKDAQHLAVWVYILAKVCFEKTEALFGSKITLMPGQTLIKCKDIEEELKIEPSKLARILRLFKSDGLIDKQTNNHKTLITLLFPSDYQGKNDEPSDGQMTDKRRTEQEGENEKEKSSKREKAKEREEYKNDKNVRSVCYTPKPPLSKGDSPARGNVARRQKGRALLRGGIAKQDGRIVVKQPIPPSTSWLSPLAPKGAV